MRVPEVGHLRTAQNWDRRRWVRPTQRRVHPSPSGPGASVVARPPRVPPAHRLWRPWFRRSSHTRFEVIHPFTDGNRRVGRMLLQHVLTHQAGTSTPIPVSVPWSRNKDHYIEGLRRFQEGNIDPWIEFGATSLVAAIGWATSAQGRVATLLDHLRSRSTTLAGSAASRIIDDLAEHPLVDTTTVASRYDVSRQSREPRAPDDCGQRVSSPSAPSPDGRRDGHERCMEAPSSSTFLERSSRSSRFSGFSLNGTRSQIAARAVDVEGTGCAVQNVSQVFLYRSSLCV